MPRKTRQSSCLTTCCTSCFNEAAARCRGKLASSPESPAGVVGFNEAAARCRGKPVELLRAAGAEILASMRPRPDAAENPQAPGGARQPEHGFNEAAARCRGKRRPAPLPRAGAGGFNEAAARCRGKREWERETRAVIDALQ